jgi:LysR family transcriptional regulator (chromosome initiation inhibitor)
MKNIDYKLIQALDTVINEQQFEKAADKLHITQSAISQRIKQLEQVVAQPVLIRGQPLRATEVGQLLLRHFRQVKQLELDLAQQLFPDQQNKHISIPIAVNADSLASWFIPAIAPMLKTNAIQLNLQVCDETKTQELLKKGEVFAALSSQKQSFSGCKTQKIGDLDYILCASPNFVTQYFNQGVNQKSIKRAPAVVYDQYDNMHQLYIEKYFHVKATDYPYHIMRSSEAFVAMALADLAYCLLPQTQAQNFIESGELIDLAPEHHITQTLYWHSWVLERGVFKDVSDTVVSYGNDLLISLSKA